MAFKRITPMNIYEIIRRWHSGQTIRKIARILEYDRKTVRKFINIAKSNGLAPERTLPPKQEVIALFAAALPKTQRPANAQELLQVYLPEIIELINQPQNPLKPKSAFEVICRKHDLTGKVSYSTFKRFAKVNELVISPQKTTCRIEVAPGVEVQIDYGKMGLLHDPLSGKKRTVFAFIAALAHSRHKFVEEYGQRTHGTTQQKPFPVFQEHEKAHLKRLPSEAFQISQWKQASVHPDHYIQFNKKSYSVPHAYVGKKVWVRATDKLIQIYYQDKLIKQHTITTSYRHTDLNDFPANIKAALDHGLPRHIQNQAETVGPNFYQLVRKTLEPHAFINLRKAQGLVSLTSKWKPNLIEQAAAYALKHRISVTPKNFQRLLEMLDQQNQSVKPVPMSQQTMEFIRDFDYFFNHPFPKQKES